MLSSSDDENAESNDDIDAPDSILWIIDVWTLLEFMLLLASFVAITLHFKAAGKKMSKLTQFHIAHVMFSIYFVTWEALESFTWWMRKIQFPECNSYLWAIRNIGEDIMFAATWVLFAHYWERILGGVSDRRRLWRVILFTLASLIGAAVNVKYPGIVGCLWWEQKNPSNTRLRSIELYAARSLFAALLFLDSTRLASLSYLRVLDLERQRLVAGVRSTSGTFSMMKMIQKAWYLYFICASYLGFFACMLAMTFRDVNADHYAFEAIPLCAELLYFILPGFLMLRATWKRRYLVLTADEDTLRGATATACEDILSVGSGGFEESALGDPLLDEDIEERLCESFDPDHAHFNIHANNEGDVDLSTLLVETPGLRSVFDFQSSHQIPVVVREELTPPAYATSRLVRLFLEDIALPHLKQKQANINASIHLLVQRSRPAIVERRGSIGLFSLQTEHSDLTDRGDTLREDMVDWILSMQSTISKIKLLEAEQAGPNHRLFFKPSALKKSKLLAFYSTNLQVHVTEVRATHAGNTFRISEGDASTARSITVTYGAPAAHSLGWKLGFGDFTDDEYEYEEGEANMSRTTSRERTPRKLSGEVLLKRTPSKATPAKEKNASPEHILRQLEIEFAEEKREAVVLSQALGAIVAASVENLADVLKRRDAAAFRQVQAIGLLVHEVSLMSTSGHETNMIEDMAAALHRLHVTFRLELVATGEAIGGVTESEGFGDINISVASIVPSAALAAAGDEGSSLSGESALVVPMGEMIVTLRIVSSDSNLRTFFTANATSQTVAFDAVPVLLNLGVNEMQSVSNAIGSCGVQTEINRAGSAALRAYFESYVEYGRTFSDKRNCARVITQVQPMLMDLESLIEAEAHDGGKHVSLLLVSCFCARLLNGARTTSCKSAKDRTSMFQTLEICQHALRCGLIQSAEDLQTIVDELRGDNGVRLCNAEANTGSKKFAFNSVQVQALPKELRPPASAASGGVVT